MPLEAFTKGQWDWAHSNFWREWCSKGRALWQKDPLPEPIPDNPCPLLSVIQYYTIQLTLSGLEKKINANLKPEFSFSNGLQYVHHLYLVWKKLAYAQVTYSSKRLLLKYSTVLNYCHMYVRKIYIPRLTLKACQLTVTVDKTQVSNLYNTKLHHMFSIEKRFSHLLHLRNKTSIGSLHLLNLLLIFQISQLCSETCLHSPRHRSHHSMIISVQFFPVSSCKGFLWGK